MSAPSAEKTERSVEAKAKGSSFVRSGLIFFATVAVLMLQGTGSFHYDAQQYWLGALGLVDGTHPPEGFFELRGALTAIVFTPAALMTQLFGGSSAAFFVLFQNSVVIAWMGNTLIPRIARQDQPISTASRIVCAFITTVVASSFAPYPLVDLYSVLLCVLATILMTRGGTYRLLAAGVLLGAAINIRPAYLVVAVLVVLTTIPWHRWRTAYLAIGVAVAQIPQVAVNLISFDVLRLSPTATDSLIGLQASYASYVIRYDTLLGTAVPQQFYCSPAMATRVVGREPITTSELATTMIRNIPESIAFALQKIAAALHWPLRTPYNIPDPGLDALFALAVTATAIAGMCAILRSTYTSRKSWRGSHQYRNTLLLSMILGTAVTLVTSATETRFALLAVVVGIAGLVALIEENVASRDAPSTRFYTIAGCVVVATVVLGYWGLSHPADPGGVTAAICSVT